MSTAVAALLIFTALLCTSAEAWTNNAVDCCLTTSGVSVPRQIAASYTVQTKDSGCTIPATVFITKKDRRLCSPPVDDQNFPWVRKLVEHLDNRKSRNKGAHK
ncbi:C-C motif chemokine 19a.2 [Trichomycterus rosablanca]|uniref:C-C motif chemokine 19a.2 n=1 Tax=Trichomycterus rosablanca TaxID=2290929 RepID=UPI002F34EFB3